MFNKKRHRKADENAKQIADLKRRLDEVSATAEAAAKAQAEEPSVDELLDRAIEAELKASANELGEKIAKAGDVVPARDKVAHAAAVRAGTSVEEVKHRWADKKEPPRKIGTKPPTVKVKKIVPPRPQTNAKRDDLKHRKSIVNGEARSFKPALTGEVKVGDIVRHPTGQTGVVVYVMKSGKVDERSGKPSVRVFVTNAKAQPVARKYTKSGQPTVQKSGSDGACVISCTEYTLRFNSQYVRKGDHGNQSTYLRVL